MLFLLGLSLCLYGQSTISSAEYFVNSDPGEGNGIAISPLDGSFDSENESINLDINTNDMGIGVHKIFIRFQNSDGVWGKPRSKTVTVSNISSNISPIVSGEYFTNQDPGKGNGIPL